jgi:hypothetical protein
VILETTATWENAIAFYQAFGFQISHFADGDVYFALQTNKIPLHRRDFHAEQPNSSNHSEQK